MWRLGVRKFYAEHCAAIAVWDISHYLYQPGDLTCTWPCRAFNVNGYPVHSGRKAWGASHVKPHPRRWKLQEDGVIQGLWYGRRDIRQPGPSR